MKDYNVNVNYYKILQISPQASTEVIEAAYRALMKKHHPDKVDAAHKKEAEKEARRLNKAREILTDQTTRDSYDRDRLRRHAEKVSVSNPVVTPSPTAPKYNPPTPPSVRFESVTATYNPGGSSQIGLKRNLLYPPEIVLEYWCGNILSKSIALMIGAIYYTMVGYISLFMFALAGYIVFGILTLIFL